MHMIRYCGFPLLGSRRKWFVLQVIEEARRRLLQQHGAAVEGYLPKGALKSKDELEYVRELSRQHANGDRPDW